MLNELLLSQVVRGTRRSIANLKNETEEVIICEANAAYLRNSVSQARANLKLAAYM